MVLTKINFNSTVTAMKLTILAPDLQKYVLGCLGWKMLQFTILFCIITTQNLEFITNFFFFFILWKLNKKFKKYYAAIFMRKVS